MVNNPRETVSEVDRVRFLQSLCVLDTPPDDILDSITKISAHLFNVPIALVSLIDDHRQWFKSSYGLSAKETPRDQAFCVYAIQGDKPMVVLNATQDARFVNNPLVTSEPHIRFYVGAPIVIENDKCIGTLCIIDTAPRSEFSQEDTQLLVELCSLVKARIDLLGKVGYFDPLTQSPNRTRFIEDVESLQNNNPDLHASLSIIGVDVCGEVYFRDVTKALGWEYAEAMLIGAKEKLKSTLSPYTLYRISSTLFAVHVPTKDVSTSIEKIVNAFLNPIEYNGIPYGFDISTAAVTLSQCLCPQDVVRAITTTVDQARHQGCEYLMYDKSFEDAHQRAFNILKEIPSALLSRDQFSLHYQPILELASGKLAGVEALIRWNHPEMGAIAPNVFIPLAEKTALMRRLTHWVLNSCLKQAYIWQSEGYKFSIAMNVSAVDIDSYQFVSNLKNLMSAYNLPANSIDIEFTETAVSLNQSATLNNLNLIRDIGVGLSIDDFGTGYNNLYYLKTLPATNLKIDQSFIINLMGDSRNTILVKSMIAIAKEFGYKVIAEGLETAEMFDLLKEFGCDYGQGYWIARPMPIAEFEQWLKNNSHVVGTS